MADYRAIIGVLGSRPRFCKLWGEPSLIWHLIKQVEQVTMLALEGTGPALCQDSEHRDHGGGADLPISNLSIPGFADISLQKTAKTARSDPPFRAA